MNISVMAYSFRQSLNNGTLDLPAVIRYIRELGVTTVELMDADVRAEEIPAIESALAQTGCKVVCYDMVCDVVTPDTSERRSRTVRFRADLQRAARFTASYVLVVPGLVPKEVSQVAARHWFADALRECLPDAARLGLTLTVENLGLPEMAFLTSQPIYFLCEAVGPELKVIFDAGNFLLSDEDCLDALDRLASRVAHVHFKDWQVVSGPAENAYPGTDGRWFRGAALGEGLVNLRGAIERLRLIGYRGAVSVEYEGIGEPREAVRRGVAYLRSLLDAVPAMNLP
jgi:sugar phosphate isomerase/epimerase